MGKPITCHRCGASTPLPDDLRVARFACRYCGTQLETERYAGPEAVAVDRLGAHMDAVYAGESPGGPFPIVDLGVEDFRDMACKRCGQPVRVPLSVDRYELRCESCGTSQYIHDYVSSEERWEIEEARNAEGRARLQALRTHGVECPSCGGRNELADDVGVVDFPCTFCGSAILLTDHLPAAFIARIRRHQRAVEQTPAGCRLLVRQAAMGCGLLLSVLLALAVAGGLVAFFTGWL